MQRRCAACYGGVRQYAAMCSGAACAHAVVCELSPALISCRCGVDQETLLEFYCQSSKLAAKDKAQVGFEAKNCKRVLIICEIVAFFQKKTYLQPPPTHNNPKLFIILFIYPTRKLQKIIKMFGKVCRLFLFI